jgi:hypothetical protein
MRIAIPKTKAEIQYHLHDHLLRNSFFIMLTSTSEAGFGFIFWILAAKFYPAEDVGIATALISSMMLLVLLSRFGLDFSIIKFFPGADKSSIFSTSALITTFFAGIFGAIFIAGVDILSPELHLLKSPRNAALFLIFLTASSVTESRFSVSPEHRRRLTNPLPDTAHRTRSNWHLRRSRHLGCTRGAGCACAAYMVRDQSPGCD